MVYAAGLIESSEIDIIDINDFEMPLYSIDREQSNGIPKLAYDFFDKIAAADALLISYAEHNGSYTAAFKNLYDWASRVNQKVFQGKPLVLLATSPGPGGASNVLATAKTSASFFGGTVLADLSIASFYDNFDVALGEISNLDIKQKLVAAIATLNE